MKTFKTILYWFLIIIAVIQFIPVNRTNEPVKKSENFVDVLNTPPKIRELLRSACYDCHSNETVYPDCAFVAPISWSIKNHINEGRAHLNFSEWSIFNSNLKENMLANIRDALEDKTMPMTAYIPYHPKSNLTNAQRKVLTSYFECVLKSKKY